MRSFKVFRLLILTVLGWIIPSHAVPQSISDASASQENPKWESAEVKWRVVGLRREGVESCPNVDGWTSENWLSQALRQPSAPIFGEEAELEAHRALEADPRLRELGFDRFCVYTATTTTTEPFPLSSLPEGLVEAAYSQMALVPSGDTDDAEELLAQHFVEQTSGMSWDRGLGPLGVSESRSPVRLVFLDSQQDGEGVPQVSGPSRHGYTLVHLAHKLVCRTRANCPVELATRLALPHLNRNHPGTGTGGSLPGGNLGLVDELAAAIVREVEHSRTHHPNQHLVLNLSVGWDGELLHKLERPWDLPLGLDERLVYDALRYARSHRALVIAAAGNRRGGSKSTGPLLPAAWELRRPAEIPFDFGRKLIYAVGGVDWQGLPLPNSRRGGLPQRVAFGDHAVVQTSASDDPTAIYTGTSVSTAVASSIAAVVWQLRPELGPAEVMRLVSQSGDVLRSRADFHRSLLRPAPRLRRLSLCAAVRQACEGGRCPVPACHHSARAADLSTLVRNMRNSRISPPLVQARLPPECPSELIPPHRFFVPTFPWKGAAQHACPLDLLPDMVSQRWVAPQPDEPPCPGCTFVPPPGASSDYILVFQVGPPPAEWTPGLNPEWLTTPPLIQSAAVEIKHYNPGGTFYTTTHTIDSSDLSALLAWKGSEPFRLRFNGIGSMDDCTASINFTVNDGSTTYSVQNPIYIDP